MSDQFFVFNNTTTIFSVQAGYTGGNNGYTVTTSVALMPGESVAYNTISQPSDSPPIIPGNYLYYVEITNPGNGDIYGFNTGMGWIPLRFQEDSNNFADPGKFTFSFALSQTDSGTGILTIGGCFSCDGTTCCPSGDSTCNGTTCEFFGSAPGDWGEACVDNTTCNAGLTCNTGVNQETYQEESVCCYGEGTTWDANKNMCCLADADQTVCATAYCGNNQCSQGCYDGVCCDICSSSLGCNTQKCGANGICANGDCCDSGVINDGTCCESGTLCGSNPPQCCETGKVCSNGVCCDSNQYGTGGICCVSPQIGTNGICCPPGKIGANGVCCDAGQVGCGSACCIPCGDGTCALGEECVRRPMTSPYNGRFIGWSYECD